MSRQPNWEQVREVTLQGGSWDNRRAAFDVGDAPSDGFAYRVMGVPKIVINDRVSFEGAVPEPDFLQAVLRAASPASAS